MPVKTIKRVLGHIFRPDPGTVNPSRFSDEKWREREERLQRLHREVQLHRSRRTQSAHEKLRKTLAGG